MAPDDDDHRCRFRDEAEQLRGEAQQLRDEAEQLRGEAQHPNRDIDALLPDRWSPVDTS